MRAVEDQTDFLDGPAGGRLLAGPWTGVADSVIVISTVDGKEVFRDSLPTYTRSDVVFLGPGRLAYTAWDGSPPTHARVIQALR